VKRSTLPKFHTDVVNEISFDPRGGVFASASDDGQVLIWDALRKRLIRRLKGPKQSVNTVKISPTGKLVAAGGDDEYIFVWDLKKHTDEPIVTLSMRGGTNRLTFSEDGQVLAAGSNDRYVAMWSTRSWEKIWQLDVLVGVRSVYGFRPYRGDFAFDGENGVVRILPKWPETQERTIVADVRGTSVIFDESRADELLSLIVNALPHHQSVVSWLSDFTERGGYQGVGWRRRSLTEARRRSGRKYSAGGGGRTESEAFGPPLRRLDAQGLKERAQFQGMMSSRRVAGQRLTSLVSASAGWACGSTALSLQVSIREAMQAQLAAPPRRGR
jgi:hypothetical protein